MKILAVRGHSLASLARRFEVRFDAPPLRDAGVFAIVGPTGAGKSTLLDAVCLALFNRVPRLPQRGTRIGADDADDEVRLTAGDTRNLLRKGAARAEAEVDFVGIDGGTYRARWQVHRARGRAEGTVQDVVMGLTELGSGKVIAGDKRTEVLAAIQEKLGLSFSQFGRTVLLAQGQFASFLAAADGERAELLERMTGTEIYGAVSKEVSRRARQERDALALLDVRLEALSPWSEAARAEAEASRPALAHACARSAEQVRSLEAHGRWHEEQRARDADEAASAEELRSIAEETAAAAPLEAALARWRRAQEVRGPLAAYDHAVEARRHREEAADRAREALSHASAEKARADGEALEAEAEHRAAEEAESVLAPKLRDARALDRARLAAEEQAASAAEARRLARAQSDDLEAQRGALDVQRAVHEGARAGAEAERRLHEALAPVRAGSAALTTQLDRASALAIQGVAAARIAEQRAVEVGAETVRGAALEARALEASRAVEAAEVRCVSEGTALAAGLGSERLREDLEALVAVRERAVEVRSLDRGVQAAEAQHVAHRQQAEAQRARAVAARARVPEAEAQQQEVASRLDEAERALSLAQSMLALEGHRARLREDEPCPLCGALEHPFADPSRHPVLGAQEARVRALREESARASDARARAHAEAQASEEAADSASAEADAALGRAVEGRAAASPARRGLDLAWGAWRDRAADLAGRDDGAAFASLGDLDALGAGLLAASEGAFEAIDAMRRGLQERVSVRETAERAFAEALAARDALRLVEADARPLVLASRTRLEELARAQASAADEEAERQAACAALRARFEDARGALEWASGETLERLDWSRIPSWLDRLVGGFAALEAAERGMSEAEAALAALGRARRDVDARWQAACERADAAGARSDEATRAADAARGRCVEFGLVDPDAEEAAARRRTQTAQAGRAAAEARRSAWATDGATAAQAVVAAEAECALTVAAEASAGAALETAVAAFAQTDEGDGEPPCDEGDGRPLCETGTAGDVPEGPRAPRGDTAALTAAVRAVLARSDSEAAAMVRSLEALRARGASATARFEDRSERAAAHRASAPEGLSSLDGLPEALASARRDDASARHEVAALEARLEADDQVRAQRHLVQAEHDGQHARVQTWSSLDGLIGSADGKRFRVFAQGLTLRLLLDHANEQLGRFAARYALRQVHGMELALQVVDRDMGDELRSIQSLSGGETFLVSLALALGLSSLTSSRVRLDTLFIDEGFGSLDPESLEVAIAALEALQASGCQVGVISHVPAMTERFAARIEVQPIGRAESVVRVVE